MSHLPPVKLHEWRGGQPISATVLNTDFSALHALIDYAAGLALEPDRNAAEALARVTNAEGRIAALERYNTQTVRQRGEREYTPLATFGVLLQQVNDLAAPLRQWTREHAHDLAQRRDAENAIEQRLASVESKPPPPPAPSVEAFEQLRAELADARAEAVNATSQMAQLRAVWDAHRREAAELLALHLRGFKAAWDALDARMDGYEASTAAADVAEMRAEVARLQRTLDNTDRKEALHRYFTPRTAFSYLMKRVERVEAKLR